MQSAQLITRQARQPDIDCLSTRGIVRALPILSRCIPLTKYRSPDISAWADSTPEASLLLLSRVSQGRRILTSIHHLSFRLRELIAHGRRRIWGGRRHLLSAPTMAPIEARALGSQGLRVGAIGLGAMVQFRML